MTNKKLSIKEINNLICENSEKQKYMTTEEKLEEIKKGVEEFKKKLAELRNRYI